MRQNLKQNQKIMNKQVYLATTKGCEACKIMENILRKVHKQNLYTFSIHVLDFSELPEFIKTDVPLTDFPVTIFVENNVIKYHFTGTTSVKNLQSIINDIKFN